MANQIASSRQIMRFAAVVFIGVVGLTAAKADDVTLAQRMACTPDAWRLCSSEIPDFDAVKACMIANRTKLSAACRAQFPKEVASR